LELHVNRDILAGLPPAELVLDCPAGEKHRLHWANGELTAPDHPDATRERALAALGADPYPCLEIVERWQQHIDDLDVLVLASRGPGDRLTEQAPRSHRGHTHGGRAVGWFSHVSSASPTPGRYAALSAARIGRRGHHDWESDEVGDLLSLGSGLADRLVATVVAAWVDRITSGDESVRSARPSLHAALYGRAVLAVRTWLGDPTAQVAVQMVVPDAPRVLVRDADGIRLEVPFAWLLEVWALGLTTVVGRFCLHADQTGADSWTLKTVGPDLGEARTIRIDASPSG
jgi:hypothetical protein